MIRLM